MGIFCARADARRLQLHPDLSQPPLPDHPFLVLGLVALRRVCLRLVIILGICLRLARRVICLQISPVRSGRALPSGPRLADYDAISRTPGRNERCKTTILVLTTRAFYAAGELDGHIFRAFGRGFLVDIESVRGQSSTMGSMYIITVGVRVYLATDKVFSRCS